MENSVDTNLQDPWHESFRQWLQESLSWANIIKLSITLIIVVLIWVIEKVVINAITNKRKTTKIAAEKSVIVVKFVRYVFHMIIAVYVLSIFGVRLSAIWGAAGIAGIAFAFAAQTSVSNIISGIFLIAEKSLNIGDLITVADKTGFVDDIHLLSITIHTFDNEMVRIPNSTIIDSTLQNTNYFPQRRLTVAYTIGYNSNLREALALIKTAPARCPLILKDPAPIAWVDKFDESNIRLVLAVYFLSQNFIDAKNEISIAVREVFQEANIPVAYNHLDVNVGDGSVGTPMP